MIARKGGGPGFAGWQSIGASWDPQIVPNQRNTKLWATRRAVIHVSKLAVQISYETALIHPLLASHVPETSDIGNGKYKAVLVFIAQRTERQAAVLHGDAAAIPVVGGLYRHALEKTLLRVEPCRCRCSKAGFSWVAIST